MATSVWGTLVRESTWVSGFSGRDCLRGIKGTVGSTFSDWPVQEKSCDHVWQVLCRVNVEKNVFPLHFYDVWYWNICKTSSWEAKNLLTILERVFFFQLFHSIFFILLLCFLCISEANGNPAGISVRSERTTAKTTILFPPVMLQRAMSGQPKPPPLLFVSYLNV